MPSREAFTQRERRAIIKDFEQGLESPDIAPLYRASESGVRRVYQQYREEGRDKPAFENCGRKAACNDEQKRQIIVMVQNRPDIFLRELAEQVEAQLQLKTSRHSLSPLARPVGHHAKKKTVHAAEQQRADVKAQRDDWFQRLLEACGGDPRRLLFLDETGASTSMIRTYGRSMQGDRCIGSAPGGHWKTMTGVAAIRLGGLTAAATMAHAMDGESFLVYVKHGLLPALHPGDVVIMDNLPGHKLAGVRELIESVGVKLLYLPPYSPDFNPIEMIWSKVKRLLRSAAARTIDTLHQAFAAAFDAVPLGDIQNCFQHCGYKL